MNKDKVKSSIEKDLRAEIQGKVEQATVGLKEILGDKKFNSRLKKAMKLLTEGIDKKDAKLKKAALKKVATNKKPAGKTTTQKPETKKAVASKTVIKKAADKKEEAIPTAPAKAKK